MIMSENMGVSVRTCVDVIVSVNVSVIVRVNFRVSAHLDLLWQGGARGVGGQGWVWGQGRDARESGG